MLFNLFRCRFALTKTENMKALVKVNGVSVGMFYQMSIDETPMQMHQRILDVITYRYGACNLQIDWEN